MKTHYAKIGILLLLTVALFTFNSCRKQNDNYPTPSGEKFDNSARTNATFIGQVLKEDGTPLDAATVTIETHQVITDADGLFFFSDINTPLKAALIKVEKTGYFKAFRTIEVLENQDNHTRIKVMELPMAENFSGALGGTITIANGGSIEFPANAIVDEATNVPYTGNVKVYAKWIDPTASDLQELVPGDLRGVDENGEEKGLSTFGMQAVELVGSAGQKLQLGNSQKATMKFPLPASLVGGAPATIPLWHLDETTGMWVEDGVATKTGTDYVGTVSHFSYWNCDDPFTLVNFEVTFVDQNNNPISNAKVTLDNTTVSSNNLGWGWTNSLGKTKGRIPQNATFDLTFKAYNFICGTSSSTLYTQTFSTTTTNVNLGTIVVSLPLTSTTTITGTAVDCNSNILANAPVKLVFSSPYSMQTVTTNANGVFNYTYPCNNNSTVTITAYDIANSVSGTATPTITGGTVNNIGNVNACGALLQFITWSSTINTTTTNYSIQELANNSYFGQQFWGNTFINGQHNVMQTFEYCDFAFDGPQTVAGTHNLVSFSDNLDSIGTITTVPVTLTNYPAVGGHIEGSFNGPISGSNIPLRTINCSFRVTRQQ